MVEKIVVVETQVVEKAVEPWAATPERAGEAAVARAAAEQELAQKAYAAGSGAEGDVRQVGSKTFVSRGGAWVDTTYDAAKVPIERIAFGDERYFKLIDERPEIGPYLALGQRVVVVLDGKAYAIGWRRRRVHHQARRKPREPHKRRLHRVERREANRLPARASLGRRC